MQFDGNFQVENVSTNTDKAKCCIHKCRCRAFVNSRMQETENMVHVLPLCEQHAKEYTQKLIAALFKAN